jgi:hypothetical protein
MTVEDVHRAEWNGRKGYVRPSTKTERGASAE